MFRIGLFLLALTLLPFSAIAEIEARGAYIRMPPPVADTAAGYVTLLNHGDKDVVLTGAASSAQARRWQK